MAWETRKRGGRYYTRSRRINGRVVREYVGAGRIAQIAAKIDRLERAQRAEEAEARRAERERLDALDEPVRELCGITDGMARATLMAAGYHQHHRGEWRRRRDMAKRKKPKTQEELEQDAFELIRRADANEEPALSTVRERLKENPDLWLTIFGVAQRAEGALIGAIAGDKKLRIEACHKELKSTKAALVSDECGPLEQMLATRIAVCWLQVQHADAIYYQSIGDVDLRLGNYY